MAKRTSQRARTRVEQNTFVRGLITEANPLTYPENASLAEENFVLNRDGSRQRRLGMDYETGAVKYSKPYVEGNGNDIEHFLWKNAGSLQNVDISVLKIKDVFWFFDNNAEAVSTAPLNSSNGITVAGLDPTGSGNPVIYSYTFINGKMFIASGLQTVTILTYDNGADTVTQEQKTVSIRDTFGIFEDIPIDERPVYLTWPTDEAGRHIYNLLNQGWSDDVNANTAGGKVGPIDTIAQFAAGKETWFVFDLPSNSDVVDNFKAGTLFDATLVSDSDFGTKQAPKGNTIFENMFERGSVRDVLVKARTGRAELAPGGIPSFNAIITDARLSADNKIEATNGGISTVISYNGRMIYVVFENGITSQDDQSPAFGDMLFFSRSTDGIADLTVCHTELDPTRSDEFALLDTDGGYITLSGIGTINAMEVLAGSLFVFADNGGWQINGGSSIFTASNINVKQLTNIGNINRKGVVVAENRLFYLTDAGLFELAINENDSSLPATVTNLSQTTVQGFFDGLSFISKQKSVSQYDRYSNSVKWLFATDILPDSSYFDTELILDLNLGSFYVNRIKPVDDLTGMGTPYVVGYLSRPSAILVDVSEDVVVGGDPVEVVGDQVVITFRSIDDSVLSSNKYWVAAKIDASNLEFSVAGYKDLQFRDWGSIENTSGLAPDDDGFGTDANAFMLTGYLTGGDSSSNKRVTYITSHFRRTERIFTAVADGFEPDNPSSCTLTAQWEWTSSASAGRWSNPQEVYRLPRTFIPDVGVFDYGFEVVTTKTKLRGKGRALSLLFQSSPLKDCHLYGWSYELNSEQSV